MEEVEAMKAMEKMQGTDTQSSLRQCCWRGAAFEDRGPTRQVPGSRPAGSPPYGAVRGFSLAEVLVALAVAAVVAAATLQLVNQSQRIFRRETAILEVHENARLLLAQIEDDIRRSGSAIPVDVAAAAEPSEPMAGVLAGSSESRLNLRQVSSPEIRIQAPLPNLSYGLAEIVRLDLADTSGTGDAGDEVRGAPAWSRKSGSADAGRFAYLWGPSAGGWRWVRARIRSVNAAAGTIEINPLGGESSPGFSRAPAMLVEEAISIFFDPQTGSVRRAPASDLSDPMHPAFGPANELAANVAGLIFSYRDAHDAVIEPTTLQARLAVNRIAVQVRLAPAGIDEGRKTSTVLGTSGFPRNTLPP